MMMFMVMINFFVDVVDDTAIYVNHRHMEIKMLMVDVDDDDGVTILQLSIHHGDNDSW